MQTYKDEAKEEKKETHDNKKKTPAVYSRPKRNVKKPDLYSNSEWVLKEIIKGKGHENRYSLINCRNYEALKLDSPFEVYVSFQSLLLMNFHAHLFKTEIIGYLSGYVLNSHKKDDEVKYLFIHDANIWRGLDEDKVDRTKEVELDPVTGFEQIRKIEKRNQSVLGWYHSHPKFDVNPSNIDLKNHSNQQ